MAERRITVTAGGQNVPMNDFVEETVSNVVLAVLKSLKRINLDGEIVVTVAPTEKR